MDPYKKNYNYRKFNKFNFFILNLYLFTRQFYVVSFNIIDVLKSSSSVYLFDSSIFSNISILFKLLKYI